PGTRLMAMVKAFGYGSGALELARLFAHERVDYLGVAYADEGIELRQNGIRTPVLVMNPEPVPLELLHRFRLEAEIYDRRTLEEAIHYHAQVSDAPPVHLKIDTGMHRLGFTVDELPWLCEQLQHAPQLRVASIFSHLAAADDPAHDGFTRQQIADFSAAADRISEVLGYRPLRHIANSPGITRFPEAHFDMVRLGVGMHGIGVDAAQTAQLLPAHRLSTPIAQLKDVPAEDSIGYGRSYRATTPLRIATLPIGYADGLPRRLGNGHGRVYVHGRPAPFVGSICMDMCMVDVTGIPCEAGDAAVVFDAAHPVQQFAEDLGTIPYEALTSISQRVKRVYVWG
ncbi:MAG TPA: alanine racemase, partial [Flavobacteriales bacterium]|nr:alanine racemase [Flavobacteriales bacterium]